MGNFHKLYETLGWPETSTVPPLPPLDESELSNSDDVLLSPVLEATQPLIKAEPQASSDEDAPLGLTKKQRRKARREAQRVLQEQHEGEDPVKNVPLTKDVKAPKPEPQSTTILRPASPSKVRIQGRPKSRSVSPVKAAAPRVVLVPQTPTPIGPQRPGHKRSKSSKSHNAPTTPLPSKVAPASAAPSKPNPVQPAAPVTPISSFKSNPGYFNQFLTPTTAVPVSNHGLVPRTVRPTTIPRQPSLAVGPQMPVTPSPGLLPPYTTPLPPQPAFTVRSQVDRHFTLFTKLLTRFENERSWLVAPRQLVNESTAAEGIHIFFDASNIMIGFKDMLRSYGIQPYEMAFDSLALLMERRRPVAKRILVGSHREANPLPQVKKLIETSKAVGYECNVQEQVYIVREDSDKKRFFNDVKRVGWQKAQQMRVGSGSDSETNTAPPKTPSAPKWVEQGVDELLHLKMCQSIIDTEQPTTMVLATGDGAAAEMSDGFLAHVERALRNGWRVELITWRQQTNGGYRKKSFKQKWADKFTIIELDEFLEDLIDTP